ncbi:MAG: transketolase C-terminal domain-containing protein, partial [Thermoplasmatales archaeon]
WGSIDLNIPSQSSPTGSQFLPAVGVALGLKLGQKKERAEQKVLRCVYVSAGEGACAEGDFHEALNWASKDRLPIVFVIHNNQWAISVNFKELWCADSISKISGSYLKSYLVNGDQPASLFQVLSEARSEAALNNSPCLVEVLVPRLCSHSISDDQLKYRCQEEIAADLEKDPILALERILADHGVQAEQLRQWRDEIKTQIDQAVISVENERDPDPIEIFVGGLVRDPAFEVEDSQPSSDETVMVDAINQALKYMMSFNDRVVVFGEDVAHGKGGVFGATRELTSLYGVDRCFNSPLAESSIVGVAIGLALVGFKPVVEIQFGDYIWPALNQIRNELATLSYRSKGDFKAPVVIRVPVGGYIRGAFYHSQNIEATFTHFPGLVVVMPSNAADAYGLLISAIETQNPVLFLEHKGLYRSPAARSCVRGRVPLGKARVVRTGSDLSLISYGYTLHKCVYVAKQIEDQLGKSVEVIDIRTLYPLDYETILNSVSKTGRVVIVHEDNLFMGYGAELAAIIADECFTKLDAPVRRVAGLDVPGICQAPSLERVILPDDAKIYNAVVEVLNF